LKLVVKLKKHLQAVEQAYKKIEIQEYFCRKNCLAISYFASTFQKKFYDHSLVAEMTARAYKLIHGMAKAI